MTGRDGEPVLELRDVRYAYPAGHGGERHVLRGVSLAVSAGEVVALMGPNGSGKTTLLRLAAGRLAADAGDVRLGGRPISEWTRREIAARVAVVPQVPILPEGFRVEELVEMGRAPHARSRFGASSGDAAAVERALSDAEATDLVGRHIDELSGGERQRVLVAMALAQEPQLLLLDEPTQHLDLAHQVSLLATLDRLRRARGVAVLAVLHDPALTRLAGPRVVLLRDGRVVTDAAADEALRPASLARVFDLALPTAVPLSGLRDGPD